METADTAALRLEVKQVEALELSDKLDRLQADHSRATRALEELRTRSVDELTGSLRQQMQVKDDKIKELQEVISTGKRGKAEAFMPSPDGRKTQMVDQGCTPSRPVRKMPSLAEVPMQEMQPLGTEEIPTPADFPPSDDEAWMQYHGDFPPLDDGEPDYDPDKAWMEYHMEATCSYTWKPVAPAHIFEGVEEIESWTQPESVPHAHAPAPAPALAPVRAACVRCARGGVRGARGGVRGAACGVRRAACRVRRAACGVRAA